MNLTREVSRLMNILRQSRVSMLIRRKISSWPYYEQINDFGYMGILLCKVRASMSLISQLLRETPQSRKRRRTTRALKNSTSGNVLLIGGGPSMRNIETTQIDLFQKRGGAIAVLNGFIYSELNANVVPDFYFILDPSYWDSTELSMVYRESLSRRLSSTWQNCVLVLPSAMPPIFPSHLKNIFVGGPIVSGLFQARRVTSLWGLPASTALYAIATLKFLGFRSILCAGLDSDTYKRYFVNDMNEVFFSKDGNHFYKEPPLEQLATVDAQAGIVGREGTPLRHMPDVLYSCAIFLREMKKLGKDLCVNVSLDTTNDSFPRACLIKHDSGKRATRIPCQSEETP